jgi:uncharacterized membrane protein
MAETRQLNITPEEIESGKTMGILAYIFFVIPLLTSRDNKFAMFHTEQAIVLWIAFVLIYIALMLINIVIGMISDSIACVVSILGILPWIAYLVLWVMGLMNAIGGKVKELPVIGAYGAKLNLVK